MTNQPTEIAIVGGGMVSGTGAGAGTARVYGNGDRARRTCAVCHDSQPDVPETVSAISAASVSLLKGLGVWDAVQAMHLPSLPQTGNVGVGNGACCLTPLNLSYRCLATWWKTLSCNRLCGRRWKRIESNVTCANLADCTASP